MSVKDGLPLCELANKEIHNLRSQYHFDWSLRRTNLWLSSTNNDSKPLSSYYYIC